MDKEKKSKLKTLLNKKKKKNVTFNLIEVIVIILITSLVIGVSTCVIVYKSIEENDNKSVTSISSKLIEIENAYNNIVNGYVEKVDENELMNAAIEGMYNYLGDPYTSYLNNEETTDLQDRLNGEYYGLGVEITSSLEGVVITTIFEESPAKKVGLEVGDVLLKVNETDISKYLPADVANLIKNSKQEEIELTYLRNKKENTVKVNLKNVVIPSISSKNYDGVGYIEISTFSNTTYAQFKDALENLEKEKIKSLVIDVRNNGGGYLNSAVEIAELFIEKNKPIYGLESKLDTQYYYDSTRTKRDYKVAVLVNAASASASEVLTAALKESYGATVVGIKSFGKGTVQETSNLSSGSMVKYTTAYWLTPNGNKINGVGITPDVVVEASDSSDPLKVDLQLQKAIETVK